VIGAFHFEVLQIAENFPAFLDQPIAQLTRLFPTGFVRAGIEPDFQRRFVVDRVDQPINREVVPPNRGRHDNNARESLRIQNSNRERYERAKR